MYQKLHESVGKILGYRATGTLTQEDLQAIGADLKKAISEYGSVRLLVYMPELPQPEPSALLEDLKLAKYMGDIERYAVVGDHALMEWATKLEDPLLKTKMRNFESAQIDDAWSWVRS